MSTIMHSARDGATIAPSIPAVLVTCGSTSADDSKAGTAAHARPSEEEVDGDPGTRSRIECEKGHAGGQIAEVYVHSRTDQIA